MQIEFDELGVRIGSVEGFCLSGRFDLSPTGDIETIWIDDWTGRRKGTQRLDDNSTGLALLFWRLLPPLLRRHCATQIADEICDWHNTRAARHADYQRDTMEAST